jgi:hypothetical protein
MGALILQKLSLSPRVTPLGVTRADPETRRPLQRHRPSSPLPEWPPDARAAAMKVAEGSTSLSSPPPPLPPSNLHVQSVRGHLLPHAPRSALRTARSTPYGCWICPHEASTRGAVWRYGLVRGGVWGCSGYSCSRSVRSGASPYLRRWCARRDLGASVHGGCMVGLYLGGVGGGGGTCVGGALRGGDGCLAAAASAAAASSQPWGPRRPRGPARCGGFGLRWCWRCHGGASSGDLFG